MRKEKKPGQRNRLSFHGMGKRVKAYKALVASICPELKQEGPHKLDLTPLVDDVRKRMGPPPGVKPIGNYFPKVGTHVERVNRKRKHATEEEEEEHGPYAI